MKIAFKVISKAVSMLRNEKIQLFLGTTGTIAILENIRNNSVQMTSSECLYKSFPMLYVICVQATTITKKSILDQRYRY